MLKQDLSALEKAVITGLIPLLPEVKAIYLFGSVLTPYFNQNSDLDIAVYQAAELSPIERWSIGEILANQVKRDIDLIDFRKSNTVLQNEIVRNGKRICCNAPLECDRFELYVLSAYFDLQWLRKGQLEDIAQRGRVYE